MTTYKLTVGSGVAGYTNRVVTIGQAKRTGVHIPHFETGWRSKTTRQHAEALRSAARELAAIDPIDRKADMVLSGWTSAGDSLPVRAHLLTEIEALRATENAR